MNLDLGTTSVCQVNDAGHIDVKCVFNLPMVAEILAIRVTIIGLQVGLEQIREFGPWNNISLSSR